jgi:hypothetical protein
MQNQQTTALFRYNYKNNKKQNQATAAVALESRLGSNRY